MGTDSPRTRDKLHHEGEGDPGADETAEKVAAKAEEYRQLFDLPSSEALHDTYNCALKKKILLQGKLFVFDNHVGFYTNLFGYEKKVSIPFKDITVVKDAKTANVIPNAIKINARDTSEKDKDKEYFFTSFLARDAALKCIVANWEACKGTGPRPANPKAPGVVAAGKAGRVVPLDEEVEESEESEETKLLDEDEDEDEKPEEEELPKPKKCRTTRRKDVFAYSKLDSPRAAAEKAAAEAEARAKAEAEASERARLEEEEARRAAEEKARKDRTWWFGLAAGSSSAAAVATVLCILVLL